MRGDPAEGLGRRGRPAAELRRGARPRPCPRPGASSRRRETPARVEDVAGAVEGGHDADAPVARAGRHRRRGRGPPARSRGAPRRCGARAAGRRRSSRAGTRRGRAAPPPPPAASSTTKEMLSSEEPWAMAMTLTRPEARAEKTRAATPGVPAIPRPTTAITATPRRELTPSTRPAADLVAEGALEGGDGAVGLRPGQGEADRALRGGLEDRRDRDPCRVDGGEGARGHAGHAHEALARHGDERLAADRGEGLHRVGGERPPRRDLGAGPLRVQERAHVEGDAAPVEGDEGARVQDLGAEVGDLRRLAVVHLREEARVGHRAGVGGEDPGHVLPEHDARGAERAGEQRRGEVGAAAAEGRDGAVGAGAEEAGHDRGDAALQERQRGAAARSCAWRRGRGRRAP